MSMPRSTTQLLLMFAGGCVVLGLLLKVSDFYGPVEPTAPPGKAVGPHARTAESPRTHGAGGPGLTPGVEDAAEEEAGQSEGQGTGEAPDGIRRSTRDDWFGRGATAAGTGTLSARAQARKERLKAKREARAARRAALRAARTGEEAGGLPALGMGGIGGAGQQVTGKAASAAAQGAPPTATAAGDVVFDSGQGTQYETNAQTEVPDADKLAGRSGSISFWMQPQWGEGNQDDASLVSLGDSRLQIVKNVNYLRFELTDDAGLPVGLGAPITDWKAGEWHQIATTWDGRVYSLYMDGRLVSQTVHDVPFSIAQGNKLYIGSDYPESRPVAPGVIGNVDIRNRPLAPGEIASSYNQTSNHQASAR